MHVSAELHLHTAEMKAYKLVEARVASEAKLVSRHGSHVVLRCRHQFGMRLSYMLFPEFPLGTDSQSWHNAVNGGSVGAE